MNAHLHTADGRPVLRFERTLAHPPRKVWRAVTEPGEMAHWFPAAVRTELRVGAAMRFDFGEDDDGRYADGEVLELDPPTVYAFRWADEHFRLELVPQGTGCLLVLTVTMSGTGTVGDLPSVARNAPGWDACLDVLAARLDRRAAPELTPGWFLARAEHYVDRFGLAEGTVTTTADGYRLRFERDLTRTVREVWACLVGEDRPAAGGTPPPRCTHRYLEPGEVVASAPPATLEYTWCHDGVPAGTVRFELRGQEPIGCRLVLTQSVPARLGNRCATALAAWQTHLEVLFAMVNGARRCWPDGRTEQLSTMYAERLAARTGPGTG